MSKIMTRTAKPGKNIVYFTAHGGDEIQLEVLQTKANQVRFGITAHRDIRITAGEDLPMDDNRGNR